jgi:hypothetical protein
MARVDDKSPKRPNKRPDHEAPLVLRPLRPMSQEERDSLAPDDPLRRAREGLERLKAMRRR